MISKLRPLLPWLLMLVISISPVQWSFAQQIPPPCEHMDMMGDAKCVNLMAAAQQIDRSVDVSGCKTNHESHCQTYDNCLSQLNFPSFQMTRSFAWISILVSGERYSVSDERVSSFYPDLPQRPPKG